MDNIYLRRLALASVSWFLLKIIDENPVKANKGLIVGPEY